MLDIFKDEGLLFEATDNSGYYTGRHWKEAAQRVNDELLFAGRMSKLIDVGIGDLREEGVPVKVIADNASRAKPLDFSARLMPDHNAMSESSAEKDANGS